MLPLFIYTSMLALVDFDDLPDWISTDRARRESWVLTAAITYYRMGTIQNNSVNVVLKANLAEVLVLVCVVFVVCGDGWLLGNWGLANIRNLQGRWVSRRRRTKSRAIRNVWDSQIE